MSHVQRIETNNYRNMTSKEYTNKEKKDWIESVDTYDARERHMMLVPGVSEVPRRKVDCNP